MPSNHAPVRQAGLDVITTAAATLAAVRALPLQAPEVAALVLFLLAA